MSNGSLPRYLSSAKPNPAGNRAPWYATIAPAYFGIFMWIAFYNDIGFKALPTGGLDAALGGLVVGAVLCYFLFYYVFGMLGMQTGLPLYVVGSSTFGTKGGYLFPGIFMGLLQIGWYSVATFFATKLVLAGLGAAPAHLMTVFDPEDAKRGFSILFVIVAIAWGYIFALFGAFGLRYVAAISSYLPWVAVAMLGIAGICALPYVGSFKFTAPADGPGALAGACIVINMVIGFFATAGAAGVDFGTAARNPEDVKAGGLTGVMLSILLAGGLGLVIVAGALGMQPGTTPKVDAALAVVSPGLAKIMLVLFAIGSMAPACFCSSIIGNSLSTMIPSLPRVPLTLGGATIGIILAATGIAGNLGAFFGLIGASFGPICGAMVADYLLSGRKWSGPRAGVSIAGYAAWVVGFLVGICNNPMVTNRLDREFLPGWHPTAVYSFVVAFVLYAVLAKAGLQGKPVEWPQAK